MPHGAYLPVVSTLCAILGASDVVPTAECIKDTDIAFCMLWHRTDITAP